MSNLGQDQVKLNQSKSIVTQLKEVARQETGLKVLKEKKATYTDFKFRISEMQDAVSLGSTSVKENTEYKQKRNEAIRAALKLTKKATAYTLELSDQFKEINKRDLSGLSADDLLMRVESIDFSPEMIYSDMILKNFGEYMGILNCYEELLKRDDANKDRLEKITPVMTLFKDRMRAFCEANRLNLKGEVLKDKTKAYTMSEKQMNDWFGEIAKYRKKTDDDYDPTESSLSNEELEEALQEQDVSEDEMVKEPLSIDTVKDRIRNLSGLKKAYEQFRKLREDFETEKYTRDHTPRVKEKKNVKESSVKKIKLDEDFEIIGELETGKEKTKIETEVNEIDEDFEIVGELETGKTKTEKEEENGIDEDFEIAGELETGKEKTEKKSETIESLDDIEIIDEFEISGKKTEQKKESGKTVNDYEILDEEILEEEDEEQTDAKTEILEKKQSDYEKICQLKKAELEARAMYLLAKKEALYNKAKRENDPNADEILKSLLKTREDVKRIKDRHVREEIRGGEGVIRQSRSVNAVSRSEAVSTDSDRKAYESRMVLMNLCTELKNKLPKDRKLVQGNSEINIQTRKLYDILEKAEKYTLNTRYRVGYTEETANLKELVKAVEAHYETYQDGGYYAEEYVKIKKYLDDLTKGNLDTSQIPPGKIRDFHGQRPVEGGSHSSGWKRNGILTTFSHWSSKTDTPLFSHEPSVNDLKQRMVSNCYMVSATATLCELSPEYIKNMMKDNGDGTVTVRLYQDKDLDDPDYKADKARLESVRWKKDEEFSADTSSEGTQTRKDQMISALMRIQRSKNLGKKDFNLTGMNEKTDELLRAVGGSDTNTYSTVDSVLTDLISRIPEFDEYLRQGIINGKAADNFNDLAQKLWDSIMNFKNSDDGDGLEDLLNKHRKEIELDRTNMEAVYVRVDKEVPRLFSSDLLSAGALWMQMIEKACAHLGRKRVNGQMNTGYRSLWYGDGGTVIKMLTGAKHENVPVNDDLFEKICNWKHDNVIYTTGAKNKAQGTDTNHAYSVLGGYQKNGIRYVRMRNPYSQGSSTYDYGTGEDTLSKSGVMNFIGGSDESYGQFDIKWEDFVKNFSPVTACRMDGFAPDNK